MSSLQKKGYYVRIARRPAQSRERKEGWQPTILVVDDDPDLQKLIGTFFKMEGFNPRAAFKRADIPDALRQLPVADLILLDVQLPDGDGFHILAQMRLHPGLKAMPIIMLTAEATREAVLKGLRAGADGYVTKPFEPDSVVTAVKVVLGLSGP
jgi:DNA-binding response OmpR family regulator